MTQEKVFMFIEPVFGKSFFGREEVLGRINKRVTALKGGYRQNVALAGPMLAGKSSILRHFLSTTKDSDILPIYIEMGGDDFKVFARRFVASLLYRFLHSIGEPSGGDFDTLKAEAGKYIPKTVMDIEVIERLVGNKKLDIAYEEILKLTSTFKEETGKSCVVILDEFHNLSNFKLKKPFQIFGKFIMIQKNTMYIVSSSQKTLLKEILSKKLSLLFGNFEIIDVNGFDSQTARSFISDNMKEITAEEKIKDYLIQVSEGSPFYLEVLSDRFSELIRDAKNSRSHKECLLDVFYEILYDSNGVLNQYFTNNINFFLERKTRRQFIPILVSLSKGNATLQAMQKDMGRTDKMLSLKLQKLQEMDLVINSGIFYKISEKMFEYWLKYVYNLKTRSMIDDMDLRSVEFKNLMQKDFEGYCKFSEKSMIETVCSLFERFNNEKIKVGMNCRIMPKFDTVLTDRVTDVISSITGKIKDKIWLCHIKEIDMVTEADILDFVSIKKSDKNNIVRKICICLKGIDQDAFLLAKEHNIWVWDIKQVNKLLRLFHDYEIVL